MEIGNSLWELLILDHTENCINFDRKQICINRSATDKEIINLLTLAYIHEYGYTDFAEIAQVSWFIAQNFDDINEKSAWLREQLR